MSGRISQSIISAIIAAIVSPMVPAYSDSSSDVSNSSSQKSNLQNSSSDSAAGSSASDRESKTKDGPEAAELDKAKSSNTQKAAEPPTQKEGDEMGAKIGVNDPAPDLALPDQKGNVVSLKDFHGKKVVVVFFYPKDNTRVCTAEACTFRDSYETFQELGAEVIGISSDSVDSHKKFAEKNHLPFPLLADTSGMVRKAFGVPNSVGVIPGRVTYVIDKQGVIRYLFNSMMDGAKHVSEAMKIVKDLSDNKPAS